jgi:hypothetical protein
VTYSSGALSNKIAALAACTDDEGTTPMPSSTTVSTTTVAANGTRRASNAAVPVRPYLLVHGGGQDAAMLAGQAADLAAAGYGARRSPSDCGRAGMPTSHTPMTSNTRMGVGWVCYAAD